MQFSILHYCLSNAHIRLSNRFKQRKQSTENNEKVDLIRLTCSLFATLFKFLHNSYSCQRKQSFLKICFNKQKQKTKKQKKKQKKTTSPPSQQQENKINNSPLPKKNNKKKQKNRNKNKNKKQQQINKKNPNKTTKTKTVYV